MTKQEKLKIKAALEKLIDGVAAVVDALDPSLRDMALKMGMAVAARLCKQKCRDEDEE